MTTWKELGACKGMPVGVFYPDSTKKDFQVLLKKAIGICNGCPVQQECLEYALQNERFGVWGGVSERGRVRIKRARS
jgi:WhiB family transcriptional regulator, redox-sensing transcriptional regulator